MNETNFDWDDLRLFLAVARSGGLAPAAESTGKSAPTLGRRMLTLEKRLGQELFNRLPRGYSLTEPGLTLMQTALTLENAIGPITEGSASHRTRRVKISAGTWVTHLLSQQVAKLAGDPSVVLQFISADHVLDIAHREAVIGVRNHRPTQISLGGRQTQPIRFAVYAANMQVATWVSVLGPTPSSEWVREKIETSACIEVTNPRNALDMAVSGAVKMVLPTFIGNTTSGLQRVSDEIEELEHTQWLVTHHEDRHVPEVRAVIEKVHAVLVGSHS